MSLVSWVENIPSGTSTVGSFPPFARSVWTAIAAGMATELFWPGTGGSSASSAGVLQPGGSRVFLGPQSQSSNSATGDIVGRGMLWSDTSRLVAYDSTGTHLIGTPYLVERIAGAGSSLSTIGVYHVTLADVIVVASGVSLVTVTKTFVNPFLDSESPQLFTALSSGSTGQGDYRVSVSACTPGGFSAQVSLNPNSNSGATIFWYATGVMGTV